MINKATEIDALSDSFFVERVVIIGDPRKTREYSR